MDTNISIKVKVEHLGRVVYYGQLIYTSPCRTCKKGGHATRICQNRKQQWLAAFIIHAKINLSNHPLQNLQKICTISKSTEHVCISLNSNQQKFLRYFIQLGYNKAAHQISASYNISLRYIFGEGCSCCSSFDRRKQSQL